MTDHTFADWVVLLMNLAWLVAFGFAWTFSRHQGIVLAAREPGHPEVIAALVDGERGRT